ncbi:MAG: thiamine pyrophosphate-requiring protein [Chloroflexota bacterium]
MKGAQAIAKLLKAEGVEHLFCFPTNPIIDAAADLDIRPIMARTERTVVGMADAYSRVTNGRRLGVLAVQYGPGSENTFGGIAQAYSDSTPLLALPGGIYQDRLDVKPNFSATPNFQNIAKWAARINKVERIPEFMRRAFTYLRAGRPGPVVLEAPLDVQAADLDDSALDGYRSPVGARSQANPADVRAAVTALLAAKQPFIHAGLGVLYAEAWEELQEFAELLELPVMTTLTGKSAFPEDHPLSLGSGGLAGPLMAARYLAESDLIFGIGSSFTISPFAAPIPKGKVAIQLCVDERDFGKDYPTAFPLLGDAKLVLRQLIEEAQRQVGSQGKRGDGATARAVAGIRDQWLSEWLPRLESNETPISPYRVMRDVQAALDLRETIATHDAGNPRDQMSPFWQALVPNSYIGWGKSTHLGYGLPLALGAKVAKPEKTVVNIMGDAAFGMSGLEIETAARNQIGTLTILMNNSCLGGYDKYIPIATKKYGMRFLSGDYTKVCEGLGAYAERVERPDEIIPAMERAQEYTRQGRPAVLEVITREEPNFSKYW